MPVINTQSVGLFNGTVPISTSGQAGALVQLDGNGNTAMNQVTLSGALVNNGGRFQAPTTFTTTGTITTAMGLVYANSTAGIMTLTLPAAGGARNMMVDIYFSTASTNDVTISTAGGGDTFLNVTATPTTLTLNLANPHVKLSCNGSNGWMVAP